MSAKDDVHLVRWPRDLIGKGLYRQVVNEDQRLAEAVVNGPLLSTWAEQPACETALPGILCAQDIVGVLAVGRVGEHHTGAQGYLLDPPSSRQKIHRSVLHPGWGHVDLPPRRQILKHLRNLPFVPVVPVVSLRVPCKSDVVVAHRPGAACQQYKGRNHCGLRIADCGVTIRNPQSEIRNQRLPSSPAPPLPCSRRFRPMAPTGRSHWLPQRNRPPLLNQVPDGHEPEGREDTDSRQGSDGSGVVGRVVAEQGGQHHDTDPKGQVDVGASSRALRRAE